MAHGDDINRGSRSIKAEDVLPKVYTELRRLAASKLAREAAGHTLQPTALVHEAWLRMEKQRQREFDGRTGFFKAAAETMRRVLIDRARAKLSGKRYRTRTAKPNDRTAAGLE